MTTQVLVPMDDSELAERALHYALDLYPEADVTVLHVVGEPSPMLAKMANVAIDDDTEQLAEEYAEEIFDRARTIAADADTEVETTIGYGSPAKEIINRSEEYDAVVIGSHGGTLADRLLMGDIAQRVVHHAPVPVTTVR